MKFKQGNEYTLRRIIVLIILILLVFGVFKLISKGLTSSSKSNSNKQTPDSSVSVQNTTQNENTISNTKNLPENDISFTLATTGDIMCHNTNFQDAYNSSTKSYDFAYYFTDIKQYIAEADITVGNLETTLAGSKRGYSGYPTFNTPEILAKNLKDAGFDVVSTANNHCMDKGYSGIESTIDNLDAAGLAHTGTFKSEKDQQKILIKDVKGLKIAFLSFTYGTNGISIPKDKTYAVNLIDKKLIKSQIELAKKEDPDLICVSMHWGIEYQTKANKEQENLADYLFENGVDVILGNHSHVPQQMEKREIKLADGTTKDGFVIYSLGNFMANQNKQYTNDSAILKIEMTKHKEDGKISIDKVTYTPTYMYKNPSKSTKKFKILDINNEIKKYESKAAGAVSKSLYNALVTERKNIKRIIGNEIK